MNVADRPPLRTGVVMVLALFALAACGGGDSDGGGGSGGGGGGSGTVPVVPLPGPLRLTAGNADDAADTALQMARLALDYGRHGAVITKDLWGAGGIGESVSTHPCLDAGSMQLILSYGANASFGTGDDARLRYENCRHAGTTTNGSLRIFVTAHEPVPAPFDYSLGMRTRAASLRTDSGSGESIVNGTLEVTYFNARRRDRYLVRGARLDYETPWGLYAYSDFEIELEHDHVHETYTLRFSGTVSSDLLGGHFDVHTEEALGGSLQNAPQTGLLIIAGASGTSVRIRPEGPGDPGAARVELHGDPAAPPPWLRPWGGSVIALGSVTVRPGGNPEPLRLSGHRIGLGAAGGSLALDGARDRIHVSVPARNEVVTVSAGTLGVLERTVIGSRPHGLALAADGATLFIANDAGGSVTALDLHTGQRETLAVEAAIGHWHATQVTEVAPGRVLVTSGTDYIGYAAGADLATGLVQRAADGMVVRYATPAAANTALQLAYLYQNGRVFALDASAPELPVLLEAPLAMGGPLVLDATGARLVAGGGTVLHATTLAHEAQLAERGLPRLTRDDREVWFLRGDGTLAAVDLQLQRLLDEYSPDCGPDLPTEHLHLGAGRWALLAGDALCVVDTATPGEAPAHAPSPPPPQPRVSTLASVETPLGAYSFDIAVDRAGSLAYVSQPYAEQVVVVSTVDGSELARIPVPGGPLGLALSSDGATLYAALETTASVALISTANRIVTGVVDVAEAIRSSGAVSGARHVIEIAPQRILVSGDAGTAYIAQVDLAQGNAVTRVADGRSADRPHLVAAADGSAVYVAGWGSHTRLLRLDPGPATVPVTGEHLHGPLYNDGPASVSPDGSRLYLHSGLVVDTSTMAVAGLVPWGSKLIASDWPALVTSGSPQRLQAYSLDTLVLQAAYETGCSGEHTMGIGAANGTWLLLDGDHRLCVVTAPSLVD